MTTITAPICSGCRHYRPESPLIACDAYPGGIPDAIVRSEADHRKPYAGDHGIRFEPESSADSKYADTVFPAPLTSYAVAPSETVVDWDAPTEMAYSPGQKRDSVGRFGSGGGGSSGSSGGGAGTAGETVEGLGSRGKLRQDALDARKELERSTDWSHWDVTTGTSRRLKGQAMREVGADLDAQFDADRLTTATAALHEAHGQHGSTPGENMADAMLSTWQQHAYDNTAPDSVALQIAVGREFKTGPGRNIQKDFDSVGDKVDDWPARRGYDMPVMQAAVRSMYKHTQQHLDDIGVTGDITLHRGVGPHPERGVVPSDFNAASSWSSSKDVADSFASGSGEGLNYVRGTRLTMTVPRERVLAMPGHGVGCYEEEEVVVLRADGDKVLAEDPS